MDFSLRDKLKYYRVHSNKKEIVTLKKEHTKEKKNKDTSDIKIA